jgi:hypothetical protein
MKKKMAKHDDAPQDKKLFGKLIKKEEKKEDKKFVKRKGK